MTTMDMHQNRLKTVALKTFFFISERWHLDESHQKHFLLHPQSSIFLDWKYGRNTNQPNTQQLIKLSRIQNIYKCLQILFIEPKQADEWIKKPNTYVLFLDNLH